MIISETTFDFLVNSYENSIHEFLDDPDGMTGSDAQQIVEIYENLTLVGKDINKDFWEIAKQEGTDYEIGRLVYFLLQGGTNNFPSDLMRKYSEFVKDEEEMI